MTLSQRVAEHEKWVASNGREGAQAVFREESLPPTEIAGRNLERSKIIKCTVSGPDISGTRLTSSEILYSDLTSIDCLFPEQLARASLKGSQIEADFTKASTNIDKMATNTIRSLQLFLAVLFYIILTIFITSDTSLVANNMVVPLPVFELGIDVSTFFLFASLSILLLSLNLHVNLLHFIQEASRMPAILPNGQTISSRISHWFLSTCVRNRFYRLRVGIPKHHVALTESLFVMLFFVAGIVGGLLLWETYIATALLSHILIITSIIIVQIGTALFFYFRISSVDQFISRSCMKGIWVLFLPFSAILLVFPLLVVYPPPPSTTADAVDALDWYELHDKSPGSQFLAPQRRFIYRLTRKAAPVLTNRQLSSVPSLRDSLSLSFQSNTGRDEEDLVTGVYHPRIETISGAFVNGRTLRYLQARGSRLAGSNFVGADLRSSEFSMADLRSALFDSTDLAYASLNESNAHSANFAFANLHEAQLIGIKAEEGNFREAIMTRIHGAGANLAGADISLARLRGADLSNAMLVGLVGEHIFADSSTFSRSDLSHSDLDRAKFSDADMSNAILEHVSLDDGILVNANLRHANALRISLRDANLSSSDLSFANLVSAELTLAQLPQADLSAAKLDSVNAEKALFRHAILRNISLRGANLAQADLSSSDLRDCDCQGTNLVNANLSGANLRNAVLDAADLRGAILRNAIGLTLYQLQSACLDDTTTLPSVHSSYMPTCRLAPTE